jgi:hypothetical protein
VVTNARPEASPGGLRDAVGIAVDGPDAHELVAAGNYDQLVRSPGECESNVAGLVTDDDVPGY